MTMTVHVDVVSATAEIYSGLAQLVTANGEYGELGLKPGHAPLLTSLRPGNLRIIKDSGEEEMIYINGGMLEVQPHCISVLADEATRAEALNEDVVLAAKRAAEQALQTKGEDFDYAKAAKELAQAEAQIKAIQKMRKHANKH